MIDNNKFLFVACVNDLTLYNRCISYIKELIVPTHYTIEVVPIFGAQSMASGYNTVLSNNAKYKIYLHQDLFILNKNFLSEILDLFINNSDLGLVGIAGSKILPRHGIWWEGSNNVGKLYYKVNDAITLLDIGECTTPFEPVMAIDGVIMATQYDIPWRQDLFTGFHFYDISQSFEFRRNGFIVGIPPQNEPWCYHHGKEVLDSLDYTKNQHIFCQHYGNEF